MSRYIKHIVRYFFDHNTSAETTQRVHERLLNGGSDVDDALRDLWDTCEGQANDKPAAQRQWLKLAAMWALPVVMVTSAIWFYTQANKKAKLYSEVVFMHKFTAYGERSKILLPDSSEVWLNGGSSLIYPSRFVSAERNVCLTGEAFFKVKKDASRPFTVDVNKMKLKVLGTTFNVFSYPDNPQVTATLETGKLQINVDNQKKPYVLEPDDQLVMDTKTGQVEMRHVKASDYSVWRVPAMYFEETKLIYALQQIERAYNVKIHVQNSRFNNQTIRAHFNADETIESIMGVIKMLIPQLNYEIDGNDIFIR